MKRLTALLILCMLLGLDAYAGPPTIINSGAGGILTDSNCDQAKYYSIGTLCQDTDDGKVYVGTGSAVVEVFLNSLFTAQGDMLYSTAASTPAALPKGAAYSLLQMNSGATAPNWVTSINLSKILSGTLFCDPTDITKCAQDVYSGYTTETTRSRTWPDRDLTVGGVDQILVNGKTTLTQAEATGTVLNSYGRSGALTNTAPAAALTSNFVAVVGTQHNSAWKIQRAGSDTFYIDKGDGTLLSGKTYFQETNMPVGCQVACYSFQTGASTFAWRCQAASATTCTIVTD